MGGRAGTGRDPSSLCVVDRASHRLLGAASAFYGAFCCQGAGSEPTCELLVFSHLEAFHQQKGLSTDQKSRPLSEAGFSAAAATGPGPYFRFIFVARRISFSSRKTIPDHKRRI